MDDNGIIDQLGKQYINYTDADGPIDTALPTFSSALSSPTAVTGESFRFRQSALLCITVVVALQMAIYLS